MTTPEPQPLVIVGAGGFGREILDIVEAVNTVSPTWRLLGFVDDAMSAANLQRISERNVEHLGSVGNHLDGPDSGAHYVIGIGSPVIRRRVAEKFGAGGGSAATLVHPTATIGSLVRLGPGSVLCAGVRITTNITLGRHVHVNLNATIGHDSTLGDFVSMNPLSSVSGDCSIGDEVTLGVAAVILNQLTVGAGATVGGSACVVRDVAAGSTVVGVPARPLTAR